MQETRVQSAIQETQIQSLGWEDPQRREWQPIPVFSPGEFHGQRSLVGYSPWGCKHQDMTEQLKLTYLKPKFQYKHLTIVMNSKQGPKDLQRVFKIWVVSYKKLYIKAYTCCIKSLDSTCCRKGCFEGNFLFFCCCLIAQSRLTLLYTHGLQPTRLLCPQDFPGKNTRVSCNFCLQIFPIRISNSHLRNAGIVFTAEPPGMSHVYVQLIQFAVQQKLSWLLRR